MLLADLGRHPSRTTCVKQKRFQMKRPHENTRRNDAPAAVDEDRAAPGLDGDRLYGGSGDNTIYVDDGGTSANKAYVQIGTGNNRTAFNKHWTTTQ